jgi:hypothetical protein
MNLAMLNYDASRPISARRIFALRRASPLTRITIRYALIADFTHFYWLTHFIHSLLSLHSAAFDFAGT